MFLNKSIGSVDGTLTGQIIPGRSGNEGVIYTFQISRTAATPSNVV